MFRLFRYLCTLVGFLVIIGGALFLTNHWWLRWGIAWGVERYTPYRIQMQSACFVNAWPLQANAVEIKIFPKEHGTITVMADIRSLEILLAGMPWRNGKLQINKAALDIREINLPRKTSADGRSPTAFTGKKLLEKPAQERMVSDANFFVIYETSLRLERVALYDFSKDPPPSPQISELNLATGPIRQPITGFSELINALMPKSLSSWSHPAPPVKNSKF